MCGGHATVLPCSPPPPVRHAAFDASQVGKRVECWSTTCTDAETGATGTITAHDYANGRMSVALDAGGTIDTTACLWAEI